jgi:hypothetical protein
MSKTSYTSLMATMMKHAVAAGKDPFAADYAQGDMTPTSAPPGSIEAKRQEQMDSQTAEAEAAAKQQEAEVKQQQKAVQEAEKNRQKVLQDQQKTQQELMAARAEIDAYKARDSVKSAPGLSPSFNATQKRMQNSVKAMGKHTRAYNGAMTLAKAADTVAQMRWWDHHRKLARFEQIDFMAKAAQGMNPESIAPRPKTVTGANVITDNRPAAAALPTSPAPGGGGGGGQAPAIPNVPTPQASPKASPRVTMPWKEEGGVEGAMYNKGYRPVGWTPEIEQRQNDIAAHANKPLTKWLSNSSMFYGLANEGATSFSPFADFTSPDELARRNAASPPQTQGVQPPQPQAAPQAQTGGGIPPMMPDEASPMPTPPALATQQTPPRGMTTGNQNPAANYDERMARIQAMSPAQRAQRKTMGAAQRAQAKMEMANIRTNPGGSHLSPQEIQMDKDDHARRFATNPQQYLQENGNISQNNYFQNRLNEQYGAGSLGATGWRSALAQGTDLVKDTIVSPWTTTAAGIHRVATGVTDAYGRGQAGRDAKSKYMEEFGLKGNKQDLLSAQQNAREQYDVNNPSAGGVMSGVGQIGRGLVGTAANVVGGGAVTGGMRGMLRAPGFYGSMGGRAFYNMTGDGTNSNMPAGDTQAPPSPSPMPVGAGGQPQQNMPQGMQQVFQGAANNPGFAQNINDYSGWANPQFFPGAVANQQSIPQGLLGMGMQYLTQAFGQPNYGNFQQYQTPFRNAGSPQFTQMNNAMSAFGRPAGYPHQMQQRNQFAPPALSSYGY